ncbi:MAG: DegV family protein [Actinomycetota bacterium]|nr:MAG: DegV family protein [Actinomycetota bacterium]
MAGAVAVVTDSTASLLPERAAAAGVKVVPIQVIVDDVIRDEGTEITPADVAIALRDKRSVSTSRPAPERLAAQYRELADNGATHIVSIHLSAAMSGTVESATIAARQVAIPVTVLDSRSVALGLGYAVLAAAATASAGAAPEAVAAAARDRLARTSVLFYVDTLDRLRAGGRIGAAATLLGQALHVKPLLQLSAGVVEPVEKVRTAARALARLEELAAMRAGIGEIRIAVQHCLAADRAAALAARLRDRLPRAELEVGEVGAVLGAHVGPGMVAVVLAPR